MAQSIGQTRDSGGSIYKGPYINAGHFDLSFLATRDWSSWASGHGDAKRSREEVWAMGSGDLLAAVFHCCHSAPLLPRQSLGTNMWVSFPSHHRELQQQLELYYVDPAWPGT